MKKRGFKTGLLLILRRAGLLCKKTIAPKHRIRVSHTVYPNGYSELRPIDSEIHVFLQNKKSAFRHCLYDVEARRCSCGVMGIDQFAADGCSVKKSFKSKLI